MKITHRFTGGLLIEVPGGTLTGAVTLDRNKWDYSVTTGKYRNQFLGKGISETRKKIKSGTYTLADLN